MRSISIGRCVCMSHQVLKSCIIWIVKRYLIIKHISKTQLLSKLRIYWSSRPCYHLLMVVLLVYFRQIKYGDSPSSWLFNVRSQSNSPQHQFAGENQRSGQKLPSRSYYVTKPMDKMAKLFNLFAKYVQNRVKLKQPRRQRQMEVSVSGLIRVVSCCLRTTRPHGYQDTSYFKIWIHLFYFRDRGIRNLANVVVV